MTGTMKVMSAQQPEPGSPADDVLRGRRWRAVLHALVARFYEGVAGDPDLRALYPEEDLTDAEERLRLFLIQYWGGPTTYGERRGHPRLRMRHAPFVIGPEGAGVLAPAHAGRRRFDGPPCRAAAAALGLPVRRCLRDAELCRLTNRAP